MPRSVSAAQTMCRWPAAGAPGSAAQLGGGWSAATRTPAPSPSPSPTAWALRLPGWASHAGAMVSRDNGWKPTGLQLFDVITGYGDEFRLA